MKKRNSKRSFRLTRVEVWALREKYTATIQNLTSIHTQIHNCTFLSECQWKKGWLCSPKKASRCFSDCNLAPKYLGSFLHLIRYNCCTISCSWSWLRKTWAEKWTFTYQNSFQSKNCWTYRCQYRLCSRTRGCSWMSMNYDLFIISYE